MLAESGEADFKVLLFRYKACRLLHVFQGSFVPHNIEIGPVVQEKMILKYVILFYIPPLPPVQSHPQKRI